MVAFQRYHLTIFLLLVFLIGCAKVPLTGRRQLSLVPESELTSLSFSQYDELIAQSTLSDDPQKVAMLQRVGQRVAAAAEQYMKDNGMGDELKYYEWEFNLIKADSIINAFCMPGGKVAFYTGILPVTQDEAGVAVVMGHEVAHAIANHGGERMSQMLLAQLGGVGLQIALQEKPQQTQQLAMAAYGVGAQVGILLPYSRTHESEADKIGLIFSSMAGYDPRAAIPFWERMGELGGARPPEFLSTHPNPEKRVDQLQEWMPEALRYYEESSKAGRQ
ncbi:MAG: M48 family peptidase [Candidatus Zixiibacteriota bacterium]|nr:MAG: M48 family peptidase [candidate division Zixibacteria bacterium]